MYNLSKQFKIYLHFKSFCFYHLQRDLHTLLTLFKKHSLRFIDHKTINLPMVVKKFSAVRSPFVSKLSKEQFEIRLYRSLIIYYTDNLLFIKFFRAKLNFNFKHSYYKLSYFYKNK